MCAVDDVHVVIEVIFLMLIQKSDFNLHIDHTDILFHANKGITSQSHASLT